MRKDPSKYFFEIIIILIHFTPLSIIGIILGSFLIVYRIIFASKIDILSIFLLLSPAIVFGEKLPFDSTFVIGPIAMSSKFFAALSVPIRLIMTYNLQKEKWLLFLWFLAFILTCFGLYLAVIGGFTSDGGITVGLRITLSIGALLFPSFTKISDLKYNIKIISRISLIIYIFGLMSGHWYFVTLGLVPLLFFYDNSIIWKLLSLVPGIYFIIDGSTPFTTSSIYFISFLALLIQHFKNSKRPIYFFSKISTFTIWLTPVFVVLIVISGNFFGVLNSIGSERFLNKLLQDRGVLWIYTIDLIAKSNLFIVPAARNIPITDYGIIGDSDWGPGAHNISLEIIRQNGFFVFVILFLIIGFYFVWKLSNKRIDKYLLSVIICFFIIYSINGQVGQAIIYDGQGFLFWLILGQIFKLNTNSIDV